MLTIATLKKVDQKPDFAQAMLVYYLLQLSDILGYSINLHNCAICNKNFHKAFYNTDVNRLICKQCAHPGDHAITAREIDFLRQAIQRQPHDIGLEPFTKTNFSQAGKFLLKYLAWHMEVSPILKSLQTLQSLKL